MREAVVHVARRAPDLAGRTVEQKWELAGLLEARACRDSAILVRDLAGQVAERPVETSAAELAGEGFGGRSGVQPRPAVEREFVQRQAQPGRPKPDSWMAQDGRALLAARPGWPEWD